MRFDFCLAVEDRYIGGKTRIKHITQIMNTEL